MSRIDTVPVASDYQLLCERLSVALVHRPPSTRPTSSPLHTVGRSMRLRSASLGPAAAAAVIALSGPALAKEYPIGEPKLASGMEVAAVYLQPVEMDPPGMML